MRYRKPASRAKKLKVISTVPPPPPHSPTECPRASQGFYPRSVQHHLSHRTCHTKTSLLRSLLMTQTQRVHRPRANKGPRGAALCSAEGQHLRERVRVHLRPLFFLRNALAFCRPPPPPRAGLVSYDMSSRHLVKVSANLCRGRTHWSVIVR